MKWLIPLLLILAMLHVAYAEDTEVDRYKPNQKIDLSVHVSDYVREIDTANCSIQIKLSNYTSILDAKMPNVGNGWYNYTYNTSGTGYYYCRQNCTLVDPITTLVDYTAGTCDFIIEGEEGMSLSIIATLIFVIMFYLFVVYFLRKEMFTEHGALKVMIVILIAWVLLIPVNVSMEYNTFNGGPVDVTSMLEITYKVMIYSNYILTFYFGIFLFVQIVKRLRGQKQNE